MSVANLSAVRFGARNGCIGLSHLSEHTPVLHGEDLDKVGEGIVEV